MDNSFDIFGAKSIEINTHRKEKKESSIYSPKAKDTADGIYEAKIRFIYRPADPGNSIIKKIVYYLQDNEGNGHYFDSPQSVGNWDACAIGNLWRKLSKSESALDRKNAEKLNKRNVFYSLVYVIDDKANPVNNGKIKILKYGIKLKAKLDRYLEPKNGGKKVDIFNFYTGHNFDLIITRQGTFNNYDECGFELQPSLAPIPGLSDDPSDSNNRAVLKNFMDSAPDIEEMAYKPLSDEQNAKLQKILNQYRSPGEHVSVVSSSKSKPSSKAAVSVPEVTETKTSMPEPELEDNGPVAEVNQDPIQADNANSDDDLDAFLSDLGI